MMKLKSGIGVIVLLSSFLFAIPTFAEQVAEGEEAVTEPQQEEHVKTREEELAERADEINQSIQEIADELRTLTDEIKAETGENKAVLEYERQQKTVEVLEELFNLAVNLEEQEELQLDVTDLRDEVIGYLIRTANGLDDFLQLHVDNVEESRKGAEDLTGIELIEFEQGVAGQLSWVNSLLEAKMRTVEEMDHLGLSTENHRRNLVSRLESFATRLGGQLVLVDNERRAIEIGSGDQQSAETKAQLRALNIRRKALVSTLSSSVDLMTDLGVDTNEYRQTLLRTGEVSTDLFNPEIVFGLIQQEFAKGLAWAGDNVGTFFTKAVIFLLILFVFRLIARAVSYMIHKSFETKKVEVSKLMEDMLLGLSSKGIMFLGVLVALSQLGLEITALLTGLGIAGFIVGFALQDSLANFVAGIMILGYRPYDVGDVIEAGGVMGKVSKMSLVSTTILTFDNQTLIVPNNKIWGDVIRNITLQQERRIDLIFHIAFNENVEQVKNTITRVLGEHEEILGDPEPTVEFNNFTPYSMEFAVRPWVKKEDYWPVRWRLLKSIKEALEAEGVKIPEPQTVVAQA